MEEGRSMIISPWASFTSLGHDPGARSINSGGCNPDYLYRTCQRLIGVLSACPRGVWLRTCAVRLIQVLGCGQGSAGCGSLWSTHSTLKLACKDRRAPSLPRSAFVSCPSTQHQWLARSKLQPSRSFSHESTATQSTMQDLVRTR